MRKLGNRAKLEPALLWENHAPGGQATAIRPWGVLSGIVLGGGESPLQGEGPDGSTQPAKETRAGHVGLEQTRANLTAGNTHQAIGLRESEYNRGTGCGKTARPGLCRGRRVTGAPTARDRPMPPRTNEFQRLVYLVKQRAAAGATVTESKMLIDRISGSEREVDICIETSLAGHSLVVAIECRDHERNSDVTWVEQMKSKHERLPTNVLVLASRRRFSAEASRIATAYGIETVYLEEANADGLDRVLGDAGTLWKNFYQARPTNVKVTVVRPGSEGPIVVRCHPTTQVLDAQAQDVGSIDAFVAQALGLASVRAFFETQVKSEHQYFTFGGTVPPVPGRFLRKLKPDRLEQVTHFHVVGTVRLDLATFQMRQARLGVNSFSWGVGSAFGDPVVAVASDTPSGTVIALSVIQKDKNRRDRRTPSKSTVGRASRSRNKRRKS